nr:hypothetical protein [Salinimonas chungwhensis]
MAQPAEEFGRTAVSLLVDVLNGKIKKSTSRYYAL